MEGHLHVASIALPGVCGNNDCCGVCLGASVTTSGWGLNENGILPINLQQLTKPIHERADCNRLWGGIGPSLFCKAAFDGRDTCNGDSGSPLVTGTGVARRQHGVVSFGTSVCGDGTAPSVNVRIEHAGVRNWITTMSGV
jgi:trypsin